MYTGTLRTLLPSQLASEYSTRDKVNRTPKDQRLKAKPTLGGELFGPELSQISGLSCAVHGSFYFILNSPPKKVNR